MTRAVTKTKAVGGSIMIVIPKDVVKEEGIRPDELVEIEVSKPRRDGFGILKGMKSFTKEDEEWHD